MAKDKLKLALLQANAVTGGVEAGFAELATAAKAAATEGADILITPEMFLSGYKIGAEAMAGQASQMLETHVAERIASLACNLGIAILYGYPHRAEDADDPAGTGRPVCWNAVRFAFADGQLSEPYFKTHLFGAVDETQFRRGEEFGELIVLDGWKLGLGICYDIEFPEFARVLALKGADAILVPTACMRPYDGVALNMVPARAEENGLFVAYANYCGMESDLEYCGLSCVAGPDGRVLEQTERTQTMVFATLGRDHLAEVRKAYTHLRDRRPELYGALTTKDE